MEEARDVAVSTRYVYAAAASSSYVPLALI